MWGQQDIYTNIYWDLSMWKALSSMLNVLNAVNWLNPWHYHKKEYNFHHSFINKKQKATKDKYFI